MSVPTTSAAGNSPVVSTPARPSGMYSSPLQIESRTPAGAGAASSPWQRAAEPGSPLDDNRSLASSTRSSRRRRGGPEPLITTATGETREWSQNFMDLERMQRENKERMHGSVRSGRSSPGDDGFFRSPSNSSCRSSVRRRRWQPSMSHPGGDATAGNDESLHGSLTTKFPCTSGEAAAQASRSAAGSTTTAAAAPVQVPRLISSHEHENQTSTSSAAATTSTANRAGSPLAASNFSPAEKETFEGEPASENHQHSNNNSSLVSGGGGGGGDATSESAPAQPRLSGLPMWLKRRSTVDAQKSSGRASTSEETASGSGGEPSTVVSTARAASSHSARHASESHGDAAMNRETSVAAADTTPAKAPAQSDSGETSPLRKLRAAASPVPSEKPLRRSPAPNAARDGSGVLSSTHSGTAAAIRPHTTAASASPLMQTYLARHTRAAAAALAAAGSATPSVTDASKTDGAATGESDAKQAAQPTPAADPHVSNEPTSPPPPPAPTNPLESIPRHHLESPTTKSAGVQLADAIAVDKNDDAESVATDVTAGHSTMQTSTTTFPVVKATASFDAASHPAAAESTSTPDESKTKRPARVVRQDLAAKKPVAHCEPREPSNASQHVVDVATPAQSMPRDRPASSVSRERPAGSVSRARPSLSLQREHASPSVPREHRDPTAHPARGTDSSVQRSTRGRKGSVTTPAETAESSLARTSREHSSMAEQRTATAADKPREAPSGHLQRSTALFEMRRQQVLQDRKERERKAAMEERARIGGPAAPFSTSSASAAKKRTLASTSTAIDPKEMAAAAGLSQTAHPVREKTPGTTSNTFAATNVSHHTTTATTAAAAPPSAAAAGQEKAQTVKVVRRPVAVSAFTASTASSKVRPTAAKAADTGAAVADAPKDGDTAAASGTANASTTTVVVSPTIRPTPSPPPVANPAPTPTPAPTPAHASTRAATSAAAFTTSHSTHITTPTATAAVPVQVPQRTTTATTTSTVGGAHRPAPTFGSSTLSSAAAPPHTRRTNLSVSTSSSAAITGAGAAAHTASSTGVKARAETRTAATVAPAPSSSVSGATAPELSEPAPRSTKLSLAPTVTRSQLHRTGVSHRREIAPPPPSHPAAATATNTTTASTTTPAPKKTERRVSTRLASLSSVKSPTSDAPPSEKAAGKPPAEEGVRSPVRKMPSSQGAVPLSHMTSASAVESAAGGGGDASASPSSTPAPAVAESRPAPFCVECGQRHVDDTAKFCAVCGHKRVFI